MLFYLPLFEQALLPEAEARHALQVLRLRKNDSIQVCDGNGHVASARILKESTSDCRLELTEIKRIDPLRKEEIWLAVAPTKNADRMEWLVEKAVEIGCNGFHFFKSGRTGRNHLNLERLNRIALSAMKQSGQFYLPRLHWHEDLNRLPFNEFDRLVTADLRSENKRLQARPFRKMLMLIGPEGDFTPEEFTFLQSLQTEQLRFLPQVLRTETAALYALTLGLLSLPD